MRTPAWWTQKNWQSSALLPASWLYGLGQKLDKYFTKTQRPPLPVIGVGNLTAGGAGKTPTAIALAHLLHEAGETPHIVSRGYGGIKQHARRVDANTDTAKQVGDEALLLALHAPTWVGGNRLASCVAAQQSGATVVIADDALQHYALRQGMQVLVVDAAYGFGNGRLLPAGPLREPILPTLRQCHAVLIGENAQASLNAQLAAAAGCTHAQLTPAMGTDFLHYQRWFAFAGIARPEKFYRTLRSHGAELIGTKDFGDHHMFTDAEIEALAARAAALQARLITTEKDAVRLPAHARAAIATLPVRLQWSDPESATKFVQCLLQAIAAARGS